MNPNEAPPGYVAVERTGTVSPSYPGDVRACAESGGCAFLIPCAAAGRSRGTNVPGFPGFSCRPGCRKDACRVLFKPALYGNEEDD